MKTIEEITSHTNGTGETYFSGTSEGERIYSFTASFEDTWSAEDQAALESKLAGSDTPNT